MNKEHLIDQVAEILDSTKVDSTKLINAILQNITIALSQDDSVAIARFGTFSVKRRAARVGRNPKTGEPVDIAASLIPHFKAGSRLKEAIQDSKA